MTKQDVITTQDIFRWFGISDAKLAAIYPDPEDYWRVCDNASSMLWIAEKSGVAPSRIAQCARELATLPSSWIFAPALTYLVAGIISITTASYAISAARESPVSNLAIYVACACSAICAIYSCLIAMSYNANDNRTRNQYSDIVRKHIPWEVVNDEILMLSNTNEYKTVQSIRMQIKHD